MILLDELVLECGRFYKDHLSDNMYEGKVRVTKSPDFRDTLEAQYMPDEKGLVIVFGRLEKTLVFDEETYDPSEISELKDFIGCSDKTATKLVDIIFNLAKEAI